MTVPTTLLPIAETSSPADQAELAQTMRSAHDAQLPIYPLGGATSLSFGLTPTKTGRGLAMTALTKIVDYTPRDMTIVVEAGVKMSDLVTTLASENQHLPIDCPRPDDATIGGLVATDWSGPRRYGYGTLRDYIIGISAVDGRGVPFKSGSRVVKNVAGYDFCKLLTGSLGTLGVITQLTFKVKPRPDLITTVVAEFADLAAAEDSLQALLHLPAVPAAIDLLHGTARNAMAEASGAESFVMAVRFEGSEQETTWMRDELQRQLSASGGKQVRVLEPTAAERSLAAQVAFTDQGVAEQDDGSPLVVKITALPSAVTNLISLIVDVDPGCAIQAHAASGVLVARFAEFDPVDLSAVLIQRLRPAAIRFHGSLVVLKSTFDGLTPQIIWGGRIDAAPLMERVKRQFDPRNILNPGRWIY